MFTYILYFIAMTFLLISFFKDKMKTKAALKKAWKAVENILPQILSVFLIIGMMLSVLDEQTISVLIGKESGFLGLAIAAFIGAITLIPGFVAFPLAASLLEAGAGNAQIAMFVSSLMMVGVITLPVESSYFGKKLALKRNLLAFIFCIFVSLTIGGLLG
ncbi:MAG: permease [Clostridia bacterium]|nr:permease [Clostridia bacterium]